MPRREPTGKVPKGNLSTGRGADGIEPNVWGGEARRDSKMMTANSGPIRPNIHWPNEAEIVLEDRFNDLPEARWVTSVQLMALADEGKFHRFNRQLPADLGDLLPMDAHHIVAPLQWHDFIDGQPAEKHVRCRVRATTIAGVQEFTMDAALDSLLALPAGGLHVKGHTGPAPKWQEMLDLQSEVVAVLESNLGVASVGSMVEGSWTQEGKRPISTRPEEMTDLLAGSMRRAAPVFVTNDMAELVEVAAQSVGDYQLDISDLVDPHGFAVFERPFFCPDEQGEGWPMRALSWSLTDITRDDGTTAAGVIVIGYVDVVRDWNSLTEENDRVISDNFKTGKRWWPQLVSTWPIGQAAAHARVSDTQWTLSVQHIRNQAAALWLLTKQRIAVVATHQPGRPERRRAQRQKMPQEVRIVTLRRPEKSRTDYDSEREVEWSHRWMVTGHWRRLWDEENQRVKLVWVSPYIKGPADKPFVPKKVVYNFER
jgi:hypothetical protein